VSRSGIRNIIIVGAVFIAIGVLVGVFVKPMPVEASAEARSVDALFSFMLAIGVVVFLIVEGGIIYSIIRFRRRKGDDSDGIYLHGNTTLEIIWTAIPSVIVAILSIYSLQVFADTHTPRPDALQVNVVGAQFLWKFQYDMPPDSDPKVTPELRDKIKTYMSDSTLVLPVNRAATMNITSEDVLHGFYIPDFRIKQDAIPGRNSPVTFTPTLIGEYHVMCSELCGAGHGRMSQINTVKVVTQQEYDSYIGTMYADAKKNATDPTTAAVGRILISKNYPCGSCHAITELGMNSAIGPRLDGVATRAEAHAKAGEGLLGGTDAAAYIRASIVNPNLYIAAGFGPNIMPQNFGDKKVMPEDDLKAIVNYLLTLK